MNLLFAERARADIAGIYDGIAIHNPVAAQRVEDTIRLACDQIGQYPYASAKTDEPNVRRLPVVHFPYTIYFRIDATAQIVEIARVIHSARIENLRKLPG